jgi:hypothetical protein
MELLKIFNVNNVLMFFSSGSLLIYFKISAIYAFKQVGQKLTAKIELNEIYVN